LPIRDAIWNAAGQIDNHETDDNQIKKVRCASFARKLVINWRQMASSSR